MPRPVDVASTSAFTRSVFGGSFLAYHILDEFEQARDHAIRRDAGDRHIGKAGRDEDRAEARALAGHDVGGDLGVCHSPTNVQVCRLSRQFFTA